MLELDNIWVSADGRPENEILRNISFTAGDGKVIVITGPNGGGKSTLAKVIAGILPVRSGRILFDGQDITNEGISERAKLGITFAFQQPVRFKGITVRDLLILAAGKQMKDQKICSMLCDVGLCSKNYIDREVDASLSGGEIKRIEIAMAMARKTKLTIFDEPEAGIDLWSFQNLIEVFSRLREKAHGTILIISHQERILEIADEILVLAGGDITAKGPKEELLPRLLTGSKPCGFCPAQ